MTPSTEDLTRMLTGAADDIVDRNRAVAPDVPGLWRRGRRVTWASRAAAAALAALALFLLATGGVALTGLTPTLPASGGASTYPRVVSDMFVGDLPSSTRRIFGLVNTVPTASQPDDTLAIERPGSLARVRTYDQGYAEPLVLSKGNAPVLAPDGQHALTNLGVVVLDGPVITAPIVSYPDVPARSAGHDAWSPDSQHVLLSTVAGPAVTNGYAGVVVKPTSGDEAILAAGWRGNDTVLGVRPTKGGGLEIVTRTLTDPGWSTVARVASPAGTDAASVSRAYASPDGSRLLLVYPGSGQDRASLVDSRSGAPVPFTGQASPDAVAWDGCAPVWQAGQPLLANAGLRRPATGQSVMRFSGHGNHGCVSLAGNELTGSPAHGAAGAWRERAWELWISALPLAGVLVVVGTVWMLIALRRSRRHGEDFLPMVLGRLF